MTDTLKVPSNFTEVLMALILSNHKPLMIEPRLIELETSLEGSENLDLIVTEDNQLTYLPSRERDGIA